MGLHPLIWLSGGIVLLALEALVPGTVIMWFGCGALLTALLVWLGLLKDGVAQWLVFLVGSFGFLLGWLTVGRRWFGRKDEGARDPTMVGLRGKVVRAVAPSRPGEVELYEAYHGIRRWSAEAAESLEEGAEVEVVESKGIRLMVKRTGGVS